LQMTPSQMVAIAVVGEKFIEENPQMVEEIKKLLKNGPPSNDYFYPLPKGNWEWRKARFRINKAMEFVNFETQWQIDPAYIYNNPDTYKLGIIQSDENIKISYIHSRYNLPTISDERSLRGYHFLGFIYEEKSVPYLYLIVTDEFYHIIKDLQESTTLKKFIRGSGLVFEIYDEWHSLNEVKRTYERYLEFITVSEAKKRGIIK
ncbi:MAG: hypothetical protein NC920_00450, partial [Candidatus Omnitrophica bacterium]|nr:hypothetical protein [Candidatus Omnitrophota bacterium]